MKAITIEVVVAPPSQVAEAKAEEFGDLFHFQARITAGDEKDVGKTSWKGYKLFRTEEAAAAAAARHFMLGQKGKDRVKWAEDHGYDVIFDERIVEAQAYVGQCVNGKERRSV